jgi:hypothetical protein
MTGTDVFLLEFSEFLPWLAVLAGASAGGICLWRLRTIISLQQFRWVRRQQVLEAEITRLRATLAGVRTSIDHAEQESARLQQPAAGMNFTRRSQAIRMFKHGESPDQIAAALTIPKNEVDLLLKIHQTLLKVNHFRESNAEGAIKLK